MKKGMVWCMAVLLLAACTRKEKAPLVRVYQDAPFLQDYSIKYYWQDENAVLQQVFSDRNGNIQILSNRGLLKPHAGQLLYPGSLIKDETYRALADKNIRALALHAQQFVYLDNEALLSNAWAGKLFIPHQMPEARIVAGGKDFTFLIADGKYMQLIRTSAVLWEDDLPEGEVLDMQYDAQRDVFWVLGTGTLHKFSPAEKKLATVFKGNDFTSFAIFSDKAIIGTHNGYIEVDLSTFDQIGEIQRQLPHTGLTAIEVIEDNLWFGSTQGAFMLREDGKFNYYASERWLPGDSVVDITSGPDHTVLVLTTRGLGKICFEEMTLHAKAMYYEKQVRQKHIRYGIHCDVSRIKNGDLSTLELDVHDSDNLWTGMYLGSQLFRYLVTGEEEARQNCIESFEAMERLYTINPVPGFFGRSFERRGVIPFREEYRKYAEDYWHPDYARSVSWHHAEDPEWNWRGSSSSDQMVGQVFALTLLAEYMDAEDIKQRAIVLLDQLMTHMLDHDLCLVDIDGRPTLWGRWNPEHVNRFAPMIGDRKLSSSNIIAFLQAAYHFTGKEKYKEKALELLYEHGYLENLMRPINEIGKAPENADNWSRMLSAGWNHSDDEMYFLAYWSLYPYALNDSLKDQFKEAIRDHWEAERPEKDGLWNLCYAMTGAETFDLEETVWHLQEFPLDMIQWNIRNSHRKDLDFIAENFRGQTTRKVLPPDERPELKHNRNLFNLDKTGNGNSELSGGDTFLLPYWMGRFLGVISAPVNETI